MRHLFFCILIFGLSRCTYDNRTAGMQAINDLPVNYKSTGFLNDVGNYQFIKSIDNQYNIEIQLWEKQLDNETKDVVVFVYNKNGFAIPILPNIYKKYWNFQLDNNSTDTSKINTTFENEFFTMLNRFKLTDSIKTANNCLFETFNTMLVSRLIHESDSSSVMDMVAPSNYDLGETDSIYESRKIQILTTVYKNIRKGEFYNHYNAHWDEKNHRIYQVDFDSIRTNKSFNPCLKIYRLDINQRQMLKI